MNLAGRQSAVWPGAPVAGDPVSPVRAAGRVEGWIRAARLDEACRRLSSPATLDRRVSRVAQDLGFVNETSFSRDFRRRFGVSPSEARQRLGDQALLPGSTSGGVFRDWVCGDGLE